jgi:predicted phosphodiesterase
MKNCILYSGIFLLGLFSLLFGQNVTKGPYLVVGDKGSLIIRWETDQKVDHKIKYGLNRSLKSSQKAQLIGEIYNHYLFQAILEDLKANAKYYYRIEFPKQKGPVDSLRTAPDQKSSFEFVAFGDSRSNPRIFNLLSKQVKQLQPDLIINMGDLVADGGDYQQWNEHFFDVAAEVIGYIPHVSCLGDHEGGDDNGALFRYFFLPQLPVEELWFSFDYGPAHFVALDYRYPDSEKMLDWFKKDMSQTSAKWKFVYMHRPCYNLGGHRSNWGAPQWQKLFRDYQIDIVFAGHSHQYERFFPVRPSQEPDSWPVTYITTGGAGAGLYDVISSSFLAQAQSVHHFTYLKISGDSLNFQAFLENGEVLDKFQLIKSSGKYDPQYLSLVKPQEELDLANMFARAISLEIQVIPLNDYPAKVILELKGLSHQPLIDFEISPTEESSKFYRLNSVKGTLSENQTLQFPLEVFSKHDLQISPWGNINPELRLQVIYWSKDWQDTIIGGPFEYWPGGEY